MSKNKKTVARLSRLAHMVIALILADMAPSILSRILFLASIGVLCGVQDLCIKNLSFSKDSSTGNNQQGNTEATECHTGSVNTASALENKELTD